MIPRTLKRWLWRRLPGSLVSTLYPLWRRCQALAPGRLRARRRHHRLNRGLPADRLALREGLVLRIDPRSREAFEHFCFRSPAMIEEMDAFRRLAATRRCLLDVGSHYGLFTLVFLSERPRAAAVCVEPSDPAREILRVNLAANGMDRATVAAVALGARSGTTAMRQNQHHLEAVAAGAPPDASCLQVPTSGLDDLCRELSLVPDLVKIDVEGFELEVLRGGRGTLGGHRPVLLLELHPHLLHRRGSSLEQVTELLAGLGYRPRSLRGDELAWADVAALEEVSRIVCRGR